MAQFFKKSINNNNNWKDDYNEEINLINNNKTFGGSTPSFDKNRRSYGSLAPCKKLIQYFRNKRQVCHKSALIYSEPK